VGSFSSFARPTSCPEPRPKLAVVALRVRRTAEPSELLFAASFSSVAFLPPGPSSPGRFGREVRELGSPAGRRPRALTFPADPSRPSPPARSRGVFVIAAVCRTGWSSPGRRRPCGAPRPKKGRAGGTTSRDRSGGAREGADGRPKDAPSFGLPFSAFLSAPRTSHSGSRASRSASWTATGLRQLAAPGRAALPADRLTARAGRPRLRRRHERTAPSRQG